MTQYESYKRAQDMARSAMRKICALIVPGMTERQIRMETEILLLREESDTFWYHGVGALIHVGDRTLVSQGGLDYLATDTGVKINDVITLDLAPSVGTCWGDYARTIFVEEGVPVLDEEDVRDHDHRAALNCELELHDFLIRTARPEMTFEELWAAATEKLRSMGCENLDYGGNFGHSVEQREDRRIYIERGNQAHLGDVHSFTFEPHIRCGNLPFGVKRENIYFFQDKEVRCL